MKSVLAIIITILLNSFMFTLMSMILIPKFNQNIFIFLGFCFYMLFLGITSSVGVMTLTKK